MDDTIPQISEGAQWASLTITPKSVTNLLEIDVVLQGGASTVNDVILAALFQDSNVNALACSAIEPFTTVGGLTQPLTFKFVMVAGTVSATTFKIRIGIGGSTAYINEVSGTRYCGGVLTSTFTIKEYQN
jgi:hypothetical protein